MKIGKLAEKTSFVSEKQRIAYQQFEELIAALESFDLEQTTIVQINQELQAFNTGIDNDVHFNKLYRTHFRRIVKLLVDKERLTHVGYFRVLWTSLGMSTFGIPIGVLLGVLLGNMAFLAIGLPIGTGIGMLVGKSLDDKAARENRQIPVQIQTYL